MTTLLILTTGSSDVQAIIENKRRAFGKDITQKAHQHFETHLNELQFNTTPIESAPTLIKLPAYPWELCTPKIDAVLDFFKDSTPDKVLLLETQRRSNRSDPYFAGAVLERRLRESGIISVERVAYLKDNEYLEDKKVPQDAVIRREVVQRIDHAVQEHISNLRPEDRVVVAATGGMPAINYLVEDMARLYARSLELALLDVPDGSKSASPSADIAIRREVFPEPAQSFQARRHALDLVQEGHLLGAWGAAQHLHHNPPTESWTQVLEWLALFASSLPIPDECDISILTHERMAVRAALRVELALKAKDIPRAVHGTVAFFEAALWDLLYERVERSKDPQRPRCFKIVKGDVPTSNKLLREDKSSKDQRKRPFEHKGNVDGVDWYRIYDDAACAGRLAKYFLKSDTLSALNTTLLTYKIRDLRNDVAHNEPTSDLMNTAHTEMQKAGLWSNENSFLSQSLVCNVLTELGITSPTTLFDELFANVSKRLLKSYTIAPLHEQDVASYARTIEDV